MVIIVNPVIDYSVRKLCIRPYHGHPKGCPNYGKKQSCPPLAEKFDHVYDMTKPVFAIVNTFDFLGHINKMRELHPEWSERQLKCCLYWQPKARKQLSQKVKVFLKEHPGYHVTFCPEAMGVNITKTLSNIGIELEWPPVNFTCQVALAGKLLEGR